MNVPDDPGIIVLDLLMTVITLIFANEVVIMLLVDRTYVRSIFFWMDMCGTVSMMFELSYLFGTAGKITDGGSGMDTVLFRTARAAKVGARVGRLSKIIKCLALFHRRGVMRNADSAKIE